jgi:hypothetical protein
MQPLKDMLRSIIVYTQAITTTHEHKYEHHGSCSKKGVQPGCKFAYCRYGYPKTPHFNTTIGTTSSGAADSTYNDGSSCKEQPEILNDNDELIIKRLLGCEYINPYVPDIFSLTKSNADVTVLRGKNVGYCTKYTAKVQDTVDSVAIVDKFLSAMKKSIINRELIENNEGNNKSAEEKGRCRMFSMMWHYTNMHEIANTMAAFYVLRNAPPMYQSHEVTSLILVSALNTADGKDQVTLIFMPTRKYEFFN